VSASYLGRLKKTPDATIQAHLARYPDTSLNKTLRYRYLTSLAQRKAWDPFLSLYEQHYEGEGDTVRCRIRAELAARVFENVIVDMGFSDPLGWAPELVLGTDLLAFADIEPVQVPVIALEQQVAEKVHAYTRTYSGQPSSRAKDLVDLVLIKEAALLDQRRLRAALVGVFDGRGQHPLPASLPPPPKAWVVPYRKLATEVGLEPDLANGHREAATFLDPVLGGQDTLGWNPGEGRWA